MFSESQEGMVAPGNLVAYPIMEQLVPESPHPPSSSAYRLLHFDAIYIKGMILE